MSSNVRKRTAEGVIVKRHTDESYVDSKTFRSGLGRVTVEAFDCGHKCSSPGIWVRFDCLIPPGRGLEAAVYRNAKPTNLPPGLRVSAWRKGESLVMSDIGMFGAYNGDNGMLWTHSLGLVSFTEAQCTMRLEPLTPVRVKARPVIPGFGCGTECDPIGWIAQEISTNKLSAKELEVLCGSLLLVCKAEVTKWPNDFTLRMVAYDKWKPINLMPDTYLSFWMRVFKRQNCEKAQNAVNVGDAFDAVICPLPELCHFSGVVHYCLFVAPQNNMQIALRSKNITLKTVGGPRGKEAQKGFTAMQQRDISEEKCASETDKIWAKPVGLNEVDFERSQLLTAQYPVEAWVNAQPPPNAVPQPAEPVEPEPEKDKEPEAEAKAKPEAGEPNMDPQELFLDACSELFEKLMEHKPDVLGQLVGRSDRKVVFERLFERKRLMLEVVKDENTKEELLQCLRMGGLFAPDKGVQKK